MSLITEKIPAVSKYNIVLTELSNPEIDIDSYLDCIEQTNKKLIHFLQVLEACINYQNFPIKQRQRSRFVHHSPGYLQNGLTPLQTVPNKMIKAWVEDTEHGLLHGLSVAFFAILFNNKGKLFYSPKNEIIIVSSLLHDFLRCSNIHEEHDIKLKDWYPSLDPITFHHSNPPKKQAYHPLVVGDRIELLRYNDHSGWVHEAVMEPYLQDKEFRDTVIVYYRFIRPALEKIFQNKDEAWMRHAVESDFVIRIAPKINDDIIGQVEHAVAGIFPARYWAPYPQYWCIEVGSAVFGYNITRDIKCYHPLPILSLKRYYQLDGKPLRPLRDHLCASAKIPLKEWILLLYSNDLHEPKNIKLIRDCGGSVSLRGINIMLTLSRYIQTFMQAVSFRDKSDKM